MSETNQIIGIDPGCGGAVVVLESRRHPVPIEWIRMPTVKVGKATRVDCPALARFLQDFDSGHAYLEWNHAMKQQGVSSMFSFGHACGSVSGVLGGLSIPCTMVLPQTWKRLAKLTGLGKDASRAYAAGLWPRWGALDTKIAGQAYADAALIALFGER